MALNKIIGTAVGADNAQEHSDPGIRRGDSTVMLSPFVALRVHSAKQISAQRDRPFASLRVTVQVPMYRAHRRLCGFKK